jgi:hypothetical protein
LTPGNTNDEQSERLYLRLQTEIATNSMGILIIHGINRLSGSEAGPDAAMPSRGIRSDPTETRDGKQ